MAKMNVDGAEYEVGYGKPPRKNQFQKGKSGNPKGRPKDAKSVGPMLQEIFFRKITITEHGKRRTITLLEAILRQLANTAVKGDMRSIDKVLKLLPFLTEAQASDAEAAARAAADPEAELEAMAALAEMFGTNPEELFASVTSDHTDV